LRGENIFSKPISFEQICESVAEVFLESEGKSIKSAEFFESNKITSL
jgi:hypothetical protein